MTIKGLNNDEEIELAPATTPPVTWLDVPVASPELPVPVSCPEPAVD